MASTSRDPESTEMTEGQFSEEHFTPILSSDEEDYDDYTEKDVEEFQELDYTDEQLQEAVSKLSKPDYEQYVQLRDQYLKQYRVTGRIQTFSDLVRSSLKDRFPGIPGSEVKAVLELRSQLGFEFKQKRKEGETLKEKGEIVTEDTEVEVPVKHSKKEQGVEKLTPFLAQTIKECIDISMEPDESLLIKVRPNVPLHQALTEDELDLHAFFREEESDGVSEYSLISEEEEDPFTPAAAKDLLYTLAENNKQQAKLQEDAAKLLLRGGIPQEAAEEVFKQALGIKRKSTAISVCRMAFEDKDDLKKHHHSNHTNSQCEVCNKSFATKKSLRKHSYTDLEKQMKCSNCDQMFSFNSELGIYKINHSTEPSFRCTVIRCSKEYFRKSKLTAHMVNHVDPPIKCSQKGCTYEHTDKRYVKQHMKSHSNELRYGCRHCDK